MHDQHPLLQPMQRSNENKAIKKEKAFVNYTNQYNGNNKTQRATQEKEARTATKKCRAKPRSHTTFK